MVKFGKFLKSVQHSKWGLHYLNYKLLKLTLSTSKSSPRDLAKEFFYHMDQELDKLTQFVWTTATGLKTALAGLSSQLPEQVETLVQDGAVESASDYVRRVLDLAKEARELTLYLDVNLVAAHKVLKKLNKKTKSQWAQEYVQVRSGTGLDKLWDLSVREKQILKSVEQDLEAVAANALPKAATRGELDYLQEPLLHDRTTLIETSEMIQALVEQIKDTLEKCKGYVVERNMPLERYLRQVVPRTGIFQQEGRIMSAEQVICACLLSGYWVNTYLIYSSFHEYSQQYAYPSNLIGAFLSVTPFFGLIVAKFHGSIKIVDYKLPLVYSVVLCAIGNALYGVAIETRAMWFMIAGR